MAAPVDDREFGFVNMIICDCELVAWGGWVVGWRRTLGTWDDGL